MKPKQSKNKVKPIGRPKKDPRIEEIYEEEVTFNCPIRGKVTQKVKIKRFKPLAEQETKNLVASLGELVDKLEEADDGLSIYSDGEELGLPDKPVGENE